MNWKQTQAKCEKERKVNRARYSDSNKCYACLQHRSSCVSACAFQQARQQVRGRQELGVTLRTRNDSMPLLLTSDPTQIIAAKTLEKLIKLSCFLNTQILSVQRNRNGSILAPSFKCAFRLRMNLILVTFTFLCVKTS